MHLSYASSKPIFQLEYMRQRLRKQQTSVHEGRKSVRFSNDALDEAGRNHSRSPSATGRSPSVGVTRVFKSEADLTVAQQSLDDLQIANAKKKVRRYSRSGLTYLS